MEGFHLRPTFAKTSVDRKAFRYVYRREPLLPPSKAAARAAAYGFSVL